MKDGFHPVRRMRRRTIYEDPADLFVAGFIGSPSMNFLEGTDPENREAELDFVLGIRRGYWRFRRMKAALPWPRTVCRNKKRGSRRPSGAFFQQRSTVKDHARRNPSTMRRLSGKST